MSILVDPRRFPAAGDDPLARALATAADDDRAAVIAGARVLARLLERDDEAGVRRALAAAPNARLARLGREALCHAVDHAQADGIALRAFALPLVIVAGAARRTVLPAVLGEVAPLAEIFERHGAIGQTRNFGLGNALCDLDAIERVSPLAAWHAARALDASALHAALPPADLLIEAGREHAHLRFVTGAGLVAADAPSFAETGGHVGAWGQACSQWLGRALAPGGAQVLVLPRPPASLLAAAAAGRSAQLDVALHLFVSNALRRFRLAVGDPVAVLSTHDDADLRLTLSSPLAEDMVEGFRWPLAPFDDLPTVVDAVVRLLAEVRVTDVRTVGRVLPAQRAGSGLWFPRADDVSALERGADLH